MINLILHVRVNSVKARRSKHDGPLLDSGKEVTFSSYKRSL